MAGPPSRDRFNVYNYADYVDPAMVKRFEKRRGVSVKFATYNSSDEAVAKLAAGAVSFDVIMGLGGHEHLQPDRAEAHPAAQPFVPPEPDQEHLARAAGPFYDRGSRYTVPYVVWMDGIGWRNDRVKEDIAALDVPWYILWQSHAYDGKVVVLDDKRDAQPSMPMQRDAMHGGFRPHINTQDPAVIARAGDALAKFRGIRNVRLTITDYQTLAEGQ